MTAKGHERNRSSFARVGGFIALTCIVIAGLVFGIAELRRQARASVERLQAEQRRRSFDAVKQGSSSALVMDSRLIPMLASDADCRSNVTNLDFASTAIDASDAEHVARLSNVTSLTFYCTTGTKDVLLAARSLPITDLYFEMDDLPDESYLMLKNFPHLEKVRFEHVVDDELIERLESELPDVVIDAPFPRSQEPGAAE